MVHFKGCFSGCTQAKAREIRTVTCTVHNKQLQNKRFREKKDQSLNLWKRVTPTMCMHGIQ